MGALKESPDRQLWLFTDNGELHAVDIGAERWASYEGLRFQTDRTGPADAPGLRRAWFLSEDGGVVLRRQAAPSQAQGAPSPTPRQVPALESLRAGTTGAASFRSM